jgi:tripartite-type tricarboxylate transporter receptor subunit TctC
MNGTLRTILMFATAVVLACSAAISAAQPARFIVPFAPGGPSDMFARILGQKMAESMGNPVIIDNRPGAGGLIGLEMLVRSSEPNPTLGLLTTSNLMMALAQRPELLQEFQMVSLLGISGMVIVSSRDATIADLVQRTKRAQKINFGSSGIGSLSHVCFEQFLNGTGRGQADHIPYKGSAPLFAELEAGRVEAACMDLAFALPHIKAGKLRALAVTLPYPNDQLPGIPTLESAGVQGVLSGGWYAVVAPKSMSRATLNSMVAGVKYALSDTQVQTQLRGIQADPIPTEDVGPGIADQFIKRQIARLLPYVSLLKQ